MRLILNNKIYSSKAEVKRKVQTILNKYPLNIWINKEDSEMLLDLLTLHKEYESKKGVGICGFKVQEMEWKQRGFVLYRIDGSHTDFSYLKCLNPPTLIQMIKQACRSAIEEDIIYFKKQQFDLNPIIICPLTNLKTTFYSSHVDHHNPTFKKIFDEWIKDKNINSEDINPSEDNSIKTYFVNKELTESFRLFHNSIAELRILSPKGNLEREKKEDDTKTTTE